MYENSVDILNKAVAYEMGAMHQYMYFHFQCEYQGNSLLSMLFERTAIEEMQLVERCAERILFLKGEVEIAAAGSVEKIHDVKAMLEMAEKMASGSIADYNRWANECSATADFGTKAVFEALVEEEGIHTSRYNQYSCNTAS